jgi:hypothetical protein
MGRAEKIVDGLYGIECLCRDFDEGCVPVAHSPVP